MWAVAPQNRPTAACVFLQPQQVSDGEAAPDLSATFGALRPHSRGKWGHDHHAAAWGKPGLNIWDATRHSTPIVTWDPALE